jgi:magnesium transporter
MLKAFIKRGDGKVLIASDENAVVEALADKQASFWLDMENPTDSELKCLSDLFHFHPLAIEDSIKYAQRPKIEDYSHEAIHGGEPYVYMVFHGPDIETFKQHMRTKELDIFMSQRYLVTIHEEHFRSIEAVSARCEQETKLILDRGIDMILQSILDHITDHYMPILEYLESSIDEIEDEATENATPEVLRKISMKKRDLLDLRRIVNPQREVVAQLTRGEVPFIRESSRVWFRDVQDHYNRIVEMVELYRDLIMGARDIYLSSISNHLNQIMKTLTIISVIALPMTVVTSFFGMNFESIPGLHSPLGFWSAVVVMMLTVVGLLYLFKKKNWI